MNAHKRGIGLDGQAYPGNAVETYGKIEFIVLSESASAQSYHRVPEGPHVDGGNETSRTSGQVADEGGFGQVVPGSIQQIARTTEFANHAAKPLRGASVLKSPGKLFLTLGGVPDQSAELKQDAAEGKGHPA